MIDAAAESVTIVEYTAPHTFMYKMRPISIFLCVISIDGDRIRELLSITTLLKYFFHTSPV